MSRFGKLWACEGIKTMKKKSSLILILLTVVSLLLTVGLTKLVAFSNGMVEQITNDETWKEQLSIQVEQLERQKEQSENNYDAVSYANLKAEIDIKKLAIETNVNMNMSFYNDWKQNLLYEMQDEKIQLYLLEDTNQEEKKQIEKSIEEKVKILKQGDFGAYVDSKTEEIKKQYEEKELTKEEYEEAIFLQEIQKKYEIGKEANQSEQWKQTILTEIANLKKSIRTGIEQDTMKILSAEKMKKMEETIAMDMYRLEHGIAPTDTVNNYKTFYHYMAPSFAMLIVAILAIIVAGSSISSEISKGTIKFWMMLPAKRWKILLAKLCNIITIVLLLTIGISIISYGVGNLFFEGNNEPYIYMDNGEVKSISAFAYNILRFLTYDIDIFIYILLAMMLSVITRNTALAVGVTTSCYAGAGIVMQIINAVITSDWIKFIPFNNMSLTDKIFSNAVSYSTMQMSSVAMNNVSVGFSLAVLGVCAILMLLTMFDSFNKRDIV